MSSRSTSGRPAGSARASACDDPIRAPCGNTRGHCVTRRRGTAYSPAMGSWSSRRLAIALAGATAAVLIAMGLFATITGVSQEAHEWYQPPAAYAAGLLERPGLLRVLFGLDVGFCVLYSAFF